MNEEVSMIIGVPKEIKNNENRIAVVPGGQNDRLIPAQQRFDGFLANKAFAAGVINEPHRQ